MIKGKHSMPTEEELLKQLALATGKLHAGKSEMAKVDRQIAETQQRENASSPDSTIGETEPESET